VKRCRRPSADAPPRARSRHTIKRIPDKYEHEPRESPQLALEEPKRIAFCEPEVLHQASIWESDETEELPRQRTASRRRADNCRY